VSNGVRAWEAPAHWPGARSSSWRTSRSDGDGTALCDRLKERGVPFVLHTGYSHIHEACRSAIIVPKPATTAQLVNALQSLIKEE
jgi:hypothetical protein